MVPQAAKAREPFHWRTAIAYKTRERVANRGYDVNELAGNLDFGELTYLVWKGELPTKNQGKMMNALFVISAEHAFSPSSAAARFVTSGGNPLNVTAAAGIMPTSTSAKPRQAFSAIILISQAKANSSPPPKA